MAEHWDDDEDFNSCRATSHPVEDDLLLTSYIDDLLDPSIAGGPSFVSCLPDVPENTQLKDPLSLHQLQQGAAQAHQTSAPAVQLVCSTSDTIVLPPPSLEAVAASMTTTPAPPASAVKPTGSGQLNAQLDGLLAPTTATAMDLLVQVAPISAASNSKAAQEIVDTESHTAIHANGNTSGTSAAYGNGTTAANGTGGSAAPLHATKGALKQVPTGILPASAASAAAHLTPAAATYSPLAHPAYLETSRILAPPSPLPDVTGDSGDGSTKNSKQGFGDPTIYTASKEDRGVLTGPTFLPTAGPDSAAYAEEPEDVTWPQGLGVTRSKAVPDPEALEKAIPYPGMPRASIAPSSERPTGCLTYSSRPEMKKMTVLQQHCAFWDTDMDGIIFPWDSFLGFRRLGINAFLAAFVSFGIHFTQSYASQPSWIPDPRFPLYLKGVHRGKHGSDSEVYDAEGRFVPQKFEEIFTKYADGKPGLNCKDMFRLAHGNQNQNDIGGWLSERLEWGMTWVFLHGSDGLVSKEVIRGMFEGSIFYTLAEEVAARRKKHGWWTLAWWPSYADTVDRAEARLKKLC